MAPRPHWTVPVNFRERDRSVLDSAIVLAEADRTDITSVFRNALAEYVKSRLETQDCGGSKKMDDYLDLTSQGAFPTSKLLSPEELKRWNDSDVLAAAKLVRSRKMELDGELRRRGYFFKW